MKTKDKTTEGLKIGDKFIYGNEEVVVVNIRKNSEGISIKFYLENEIGYSYALPDYMMIDLFE